MRANGYWIRNLSWLILLAATGWVWAGSDRAFRRVLVPTAVVVSEDMRYRVVDGRALSLDIYRPPDGTPPPLPGPGRPAILAIHGGSWVGGSKRLFRPGPANPRPMAVRLAEAGYVVIAADYRLARPGVPGWPAARDDLIEAVRWIRRNAPELGVDPDRIAALGQSAGAHLAAVLGTCPEGPDRIRAVIDFYGPADLERLPDQRVQTLAHEPIRLFLGAPDPAASPVRRVRGDSAPMLLIHGTRDPWVPIAQSEELADALRAAGVPHRLVRVEGARHGFEVEVKDPEVHDPRHRDLLPEIFAFLRDVWNAPSR